MAVDLKRPISPAPVPTIVERQYKFVDYATQAYLGIVGLIILLLHGERLPIWPLLVAAHVMGMVGIHFLIRVHEARPRRGLLGFARDFYPFLLVPVLYRETGLINLLLTGKYYDDVIVALEERIFGFQPSVHLIEAFPARGVAEVLYFAYFSYYLLVTGIGIALYLRVRQQFFHDVSVVSLIFFVSYFTFLIIPVLGPTAIQIPKYAELSGISFPTLPIPPTVETAFFYRVMTVIHGNMQVIGAAFPSSHVAVACGALYFAWIYLRRVRYIILLDVILLATSTVYCHYHYAVDVIAGLAVVAVVLPLGEWLYRRFR